MKLINNNTFWSNNFFGNEVQEYAIAVAVFFGLVIFFSLFQKILLHRLEKLAKKTKTDIDDALIEIFKTIRPPFYYFIAFYVGVRSLDFPNLVNQIVGTVIIIWAIFLAVKAVQILISYVFKKKIDQEGNRGTKSALSAINIIIKILLWSLGLLMILSNLGINVTSLMAGLGIGGIAFAFALQNILSDLFSSFAIHFDKPFVEGDYIVIGEHSGTVEKIGIKTTRIRALQGEEIVVSNNELTSARIQNFKNMKERRATFTIGVTYETENEKLKRIPSIIEAIIKDVDNARFDRSTFKEFADSSLNFETVYYITSNEYKEYMETLQEINFKIREVFENERIDMAYPTQTLFIKK